MKTYNEIWKNEIRKQELVDEYLDLPGFNSVNRMDLMKKLNNGER